MGYRVIYIEKCEYLRLYLDNLKVEIKNDTLLIPVSDIQILVIDNYQSNLSVPLINKLTDNNVCTIICGVDHLPKSYILPMNGHFSSSGNISKQICWDSKRKDDLHAMIVKMKILNQIEILKVNNKDFEVEKKLYEFVDSVVSGDKTNREGLAAKMYFRELFGHDFIRFEEDVINAGLNYGYAIFRSLITSIIVAKGYIANIGIFHKGKQNMFNLSDDIIEVFRPIVDHYVYNNMMDDIIFKQSHREALIQLTNKKIMIDGRKQTIANAISFYLDSIFNYLDGEADSILYPLPVIYDFMRLILFFDLPVVSKEDRRIYATFRKYLIKNGYIMMQYSVYCKIFANREAAVKHVNILQRNVPQKGQIRILLVTEKQYAKIEIIVGGKSNQEQVVNSDAFIKL